MAYYKILLSEWQEFRAEWAALKAENDRLRRQLAAQRARRDLWIGTYDEWIAAGCPIPWDSVS